MLKNDLVVMANLNKIIREGRIDNSTNLYKKILMTLIKNNKIDIDKMIKKLNKYHMKLEHVSKASEAKSVLEYIYNYKEKNKVLFD